MARLFVFLPAAQVTGAVNENISGGGDLAAGLGR